MAKDTNKVTGGDAGGEITAITPIVETPAQIPVDVPVVQQIGVYNTIEEVPHGYRSAVRAALKKIGIDGTHVLQADENKNLNLTDEKLFIIKMFYQCGMYF